MRLVSKPKSYYNSIEITLKHNQVTEWVIMFSPR